MDFSWTIHLLCSTGDGPLTVFAPTNEAIEALPASLVSSLMEDTEMLKQVLLYHVVAGEITSSMADNNIQLPSVAGAPLFWLCLSAVTAPLSPLLFPQHWARLS